MISQCIGQVHFQPKPIEPTNPNSLVTGQLLVVDTSEQRLHLYTVLGMPINVAPGKYKMSIEARPKRDKPGINYWYKSHEKVG